MSKKLISLILTVVLSLSPVLGSYAEKAGPETEKKPESEAEPEQKDENGPELG